MYIAQWNWMKSRNGLKTSLTSSFSKVPDPFAVKKKNQTKGISSVLNSFSAFSFAEFQNSTPTSRVKQNKKYSTVHRWNLSTKNPTSYLFHMLHDRTASLWGYTLAISSLWWESSFLVFQKAVWIIAALTLASHKNMQWE